MSAIAEGRPQAGGRAPISSRRRIDPRLRSRSIASYLDARLHVAALSLVAGSIHVVAAVPHYSEYWLFGTLFVIVGLGQFAWGVQSYRRSSAGLFRVGIGLSLGVAAAWLLSRTLGLPIGPEPGAAEAVGPLDAVCTAIELAIAGLCLALLRPERSLPAPVWVIRSAVLALMSAGLLLLLLGAGHHR